MAKNITNTEETEDAPIVEDAVLEVVPEIVEAVAPPAPGVKRALGVKEPIIFKWKVVGTAQNMILTLYKSVEREEADAQAERLRKEDYYTDVRVLDANEKIQQPVQKAPKKPPRTEAVSKAAAGKASESKKSKVTVVAKKPIAKSAARPASKSSPKKKTASTSGSRRAGKGR